MKLQQSTVASSCLLSHMVCTSSYVQCWCGTNWNVCTYSECMIMSNHKPTTTIFWSEAWLAYAQHSVQYTCTGIPVPYIVCQHANLQFDAWRKCDLMVQSSNYPWIQKIVELDLIQLNTSISIYHGCKDSTNLQYKD